MKRSKTTALALAVILAAVLSACSPASSAQTSPAQGEAGAPASNAEKMTVRISAGPSGGNNFMICAGMADIVSKKFPNYTISAEISTGSQQNIRSMSQGNAQMGISMGDSTLYSYNAEREFTDLEKGSVNYVMGGYPTIIHIMVAKGAPYQSVADLRGKKIAVSKGITAQYYLPIVLEAYGMTADDVNITELQLADLTTALADGNVEMIMHITSYPLAAISDLAASTDIRLLNLSDEVIGSISGQYPFFTRYTIPAGTYQKVDEEAQTVGTMNTLICRADLDETFVYNFTKTVMEQNEALAAIHPNAGLFNQENTLAGAVIPIHPGAKRYYEEAGLL